MVPRRFLSTILISLVSDACDIEEEVERHEEFANNQAENEKIGDKIALIDRTPMRKTKGLH
jgi:hypothetical protein